jgi:uncharacterized membrane protein
VAESRVQLSRIITWASLMALLLLQMLDSALQQPPPLIWVMRVLPLVIFVPGMRRDNLRSYIWVCFVCLLYFITLVERLFADPADLVSIMAMVSVATLFVASMLYVRWRARELNKENPNAQGE